MKYMFSCFLFLSLILVGSASLAQDSLPNNTHSANLQIGFSRVSIKDHGAIVPLELISRDYLTSIGWTVYRPRTDHDINFSFSAHHNFEYDRTDIQQPDNELFLYMLTYKMKYFILRNVFGYIDLGVGPGVLFMGERNRIAFPGGNNYFITSMEGGAALVLALKMKLDDDLTFDFDLTNGAFAGKEKVDSSQPEISGNMNGFYSEMDVKLNFRLAKKVWLSAGAEVFEQIEYDRVFPRKLHRVTFSGTLKYIF